MGNTFKKFKDEEKNRKTIGTITEVLEVEKLEEIATEQMKSFKSYELDKDKPCYFITLEIETGTVKRPLVLKHSENSNYKKFLRKYDAYPKVGMKIDLTLSTGGAWKFDL